MTLFSTKIMTRFTKSVCLVFLSIIVCACDSRDTNTANSQGSPQHIKAGEECHLCGMVISQFPGPKGQIHSKHNRQVKNFCSTNDLFAFILQPENKHNIAQAFVHDMGDLHWDKPNDAKMVDAQKAWFVTGHKLRGAMGPTLASFSSREKAEFFIKLNGGKILRFDQINLSILTNMTHHHS